MRRLLPVLLIPLLLVSCGDGVSVTGEARSGIVRGTVFQGPACPIQTDASPCPDEPLPGEVVQLMQGLAIVASAISEADGGFSFEVEPGHYELMVAPDGDMQGRVAKPVSVIAVAGETVTADLFVDTGIR